MDNSQMSNQTSAVMLELVLPRDARKDAKTLMETELNVLGQDLVKRIREEYGLKYIKLILRGKTLDPDKRLDEQGAKNHSKIMVLRVTDSELKLQMQKEEEEKRKVEEEEKDQKKRQKKSLQRTQKGFQILCDRDSSTDPWTPSLEIADQTGRSLTIPHKERKALILAMGLHEKGRSLMKRKQYDKAVCHLLKADEEFRKCDPSIRTAVDNYAVLQLDIVWCHRALEALSCLDDAKTRLQTAERCFLHCYGEDQERLRTIKGEAGKQQAQVLFLRLFLLQSLLSHLENNNSQAREKLSKVESLYSRLRPDSDKMNQLMILGFTERETRLALRACEGDLQEAVAHIINRRQEQEKVKNHDRQERRSRMDMWQRRQAGRSHTSTASGVLPNNHGLLPVLPPVTSPEELSASSSNEEDDELVSEVLGDISRHEEDYLDLTLEEEGEFIKEMKSHLSGGSTHDVVQ